jgi:HEPN domain-containing protein
MAGNLSVDDVLYRPSARRADTKNWIDSADYDLETARHMLTTGRHLYVVFTCHLTLEKMLKAHVTEVTAEVPAKTHDLIYLIKKAGLSLQESHLEFIGRINNASIPTRYPDDIKQAIKDYDEEVARDYLNQTTEIIQWLKEHPNLKTSSDDSDEN